MTERIPVTLRKNVVIVGRTNAGKSTLFNALTEQDNAITSPIAGTTTDPVIKTAELLPFGPIVLIDTAGSEDESALGLKRAKKTNAVLRRADVIVYVADASDFDEEQYNQAWGKKASHILVLNRCSREQLESLQKAYPDAILLTDMNEAEINALQAKLSDLLASLDNEERSVIAKILSPGDTATLVVPIDSEAPKGRLILPQVQTLRQCLDAGVKSIVVRPSELAEVITTQANINLVITDSQAFAEVAKMVPDSIALTSFSMLLAYDSNNFEQLINGCQAINQLSEGAKILMLEGCTHNRGHEDIGHNKIPRLLKEQTHKDFLFKFCSGYDFPEDISEYAMAIQCGGCMLNCREVESRLAILAQNEVPVTNYGILLAYLNGILPRASQVFTKDN